MRESLFLGISIVGTFISICGICIEENKNAWMHATLGWSLALLCEIQLIWKG